MVRLQPRGHLTRQVNISKKFLPLSPHSPTLIPHAPPSSTTVLLSEACKGVKGVGGGEVRTRRQPGRPDVLLALPSCFCPLICLTVSPQALVRKMRVGMGKGEGQGNERLQREASFPMACDRIGRDPSPLRQAISPPTLLPQPLPPAFLPRYWASLLFC